MPFDSDAILKQLGRDASLAMPEIVLVAAMCLVLLLPFVTRKGSLATPIAAMLGLVVALLFTPGVLGDAGTIAFYGMLAFDPFSQFFKILLFVFTLGVIGQWFLFGRPRTDHRDLPDLLCLLLGATLGMSLMASANNLLMIFIATETASLASFALAGFLKRSRIGAEGALKYVVFGAAASAIGLYGMSLIYGVTGSLHLPAIAAAIVEQGGINPLLALGLLGLFAAIAFKLSAVPLHFWCPDVFQGAPIEVTTFLSVASKGAAVILLVRILSVFSAAAGPDSSIFTGLAVGIGILGAVTATWGNLVALHQDNIKRLLAYSSIGHAGYMIMAAAAVLAGGVTPAAAILFYMVVYLFMNLGAFTVAGLIAVRTGSEDIRDYADLKRRSPALAVLLTLFLLSLFGMPGLGGFIAKVWLGVAMLDLDAGGFALLAALLLNTLLSLYVYMRPVFSMFLTPDEENRPSFSPQGLGLAMCVICAAALLWTGLYPQPVQDLAEDYAAVASLSVELPERLSQTDAP